MMDYAQATLPHESTGLALFQIEFCYEPRTSFYWKQPTEPAHPRERLNRDEAQQYARRMHDAWTISTYEHDKSLGSTEETSQSTTEADQLYGRRLSLDLYNELKN